MLLSPALTLKMWLGDNSGSGYSRIFRAVSVSRQRPRRDLPKTYQRSGGKGAANLQADRQCDNGMGRLIMRGDLGMIAAGLATIK
jgi:hypothetical protein